MAFGSRAAAAIPDYYSAFSGGAKEGIDIANALEKSYQTAFSNEDQRYHALRKRAATEAFSNAWTSGDPDKIQKVMGMFPEYAQDIQKLVGMRDDQHRKDLGTLSMQMKALTDSGDLQGAKALLDKSGSTVDAATAGTLHGLMNKAAAGDQGAATHLSNLFQGITLAALQPKEIMDWGTDQQKLAQQLQQINNQLTLGEGRLALGQGQLGLGYQRLDEMRRFHDEMHQDRLAALDAKNAQDSFTNLITPDGVPHKVRMNPKTGGYANHDTKGNPIDVDGKVLNLTGNAGMQSGGADALRALNSANTLSNDPALKGTGGNSYPARVYKSMDPMGTYHDLQSKFDTVNKATAAAIAVRLTQESGGFAPKQGEIEAGIQSAGVLSVNNSAEQNRAILKRQKEILHNVVESADKSGQSRETGTAEEQAHVNASENLSDQELIDKYK